MPPEYRLFCNHLILNSFMEQAARLVNRRWRSTVRCVDRYSVDCKQLVQLPRGLLMSKLLTTLLAAVFAAVTVTPVAFAADKKDEAKKEQKKGEGKKKSEGKKSEGKKSEGKKKAEEKK